jgi:hypothetical protein
MILAITKDIVDFPASLLVPKMEILFIYILDFKIEMVF